MSNEIDINSYSQRLPFINPNDEPVRYYAMNQNVYDNLVKECHFVHKIENESLIPCNELMGIPVLIQNHWKDNEIIPLNVNREPIGMRKAINEAINKSKELGL
jgi:hypothetical protein